MWNFLFPPKCILCRKLLTNRQTDLCPECRKSAPESFSAKRKIPFVAGWTAIWYYRDDVRRSIHRFKFYHHRHYAKSYGRLLGMKLLKEYPDGFDLLTWVPTGFFRKLGRGYDQSRLLARAVAKELGCQSISLLKKVRNTPPQSRIRETARRQANVSGAYMVINPTIVNGKRILLLDDVITTGSTCQECARVLMTAGAKEIFCAAVATAHHDKK